MFVFEYTALLIFLELAIWFTYENHDETYQQLKCDKIRESLIYLFHSPNNLI